MLGSVLGSVFVMLFDWLYRLIVGDQTTRIERRPDGVPFVPARHFTAGRPGPIQLIVLHSTEGGTARSVADMFNKGARVASAHYVVDSQDVIQCVRDEHTAFAAPGANATGLQIEVCGWARWSEPEWRASGVLPRVVRLIRRLCQQYNIPAVHVDVSGLLAGQSGITTHAEVSQAWKKSTHTDPGAGFPVAWVIDQASEES